MSMLRAGVVLVMLITLVAAAGLYVRHRLFAGALPLR